MPSVSVVIPTYNAVGQVEGLLEQLRAYDEGDVCVTPTNIEVILADDASPDGSARILGEHFPWLTVIAGERNLGFGANVMRGVRAATGEYLFLLNSDVELRGDPITPLVQLLERDESVFAAMPLIYNTHLNAVENLARLYCHRGLCWHTELAEAGVWTKEVRGAVGAKPASPAVDVSAMLGEADFAPTPPIPAVLCGAAFLCRRERFLTLGGFDLRYQPFYWEDVALGFAAARRGWRTVSMPQALVVHRHSESISAKVGARKQRYLILNQLRFVQQYRADLRSAGLRYERAWWLARGLRALAKGDLALAAAYTTATLSP